MIVPEQSKFDALYGPGGHPYYIYTPRWIDSSAGIKALHLLCHSLNVTGQTAYLIMIGESYPNVARINGLLNTPVLTNEIARSHFEKKLTPITIYSETIDGNPINAPFVVRFIANFMGNLGGPIQFNGDEFICAYSKTLRENTEKLLNRNVDFTLFFHALDPREFQTNLIKKDYVLVYAAKYRLFVGEPKLPKNLKVLEIVRDGSKAHAREEVIKLLQKARALLVYENSAIAMEAILCGTPVILMKNDFFHTGIASYETKELGMRWGYSEENIEAAQSELSAAKELYYTTIENFFQNLELFIKKTQLAVSKHSYKEIIEVPDHKFIINQHRWQMGWNILLSQGPKSLLRITYAFIHRRIVLKYSYKEIIKVPDHKFIINQHRLQMGWNILLSQGPKSLLRITYAFIHRRIVLKYSYKEIIKVPDHKFIINQHRLQMGWNILLSQGPKSLLRITYAFIHRRIVSK